MAIRVTCITCHTRFDVSEKFAGKEGPCPKCKATIRIPGLDEQVVVHAPEASGPKDSKGRAVLKPIERAETNLSAVQLTLIIASILGFLAGAFALQFVYSAETMPLWVLGVGAILLAFPLVYVTYTFLRNQEAAPFFGNDLWSRVGICAAVYSALWMVMPLMSYAFPGNGIGQIIGIVAMIAVGGIIGMLVLEFDIIFGVLHYGMYLGVCLVARIVAGLDVLPGEVSPSNEMPSTVISFLLAGIGLG
ncbi:MAG: hypothetical protein AAGA30_05105 [Planctomycetota bacterium]